MNVCLFIVPNGLIDSDVSYSANSHYAGTISRRLSDGFSSPHSGCQKYIPLNIVAIFSFTGLIILDVSSERYSDKCYMQVISQFYLHQKIQACNLR